MPYTRFPNGISVSTVAMASLPTAGEGNFYGDLFIGQVVTQTVTFSTASTAQTLGVGCGFSGNIIGAFVTVGSVSAVSAAYTVRLGSAGSVSVASVANTNTDSYSNQSLTTTATAFTTANGISVVRGVQGTAGDSSLTLLLKRTS